MPEDLNKIRKSELGRYKNTSENSRTTIWNNYVGTTSSDIESVGSKATLRGGRISFEE